MKKLLALYRLFHKLPWVIWNAVAYALFATPGSKSHPSKVIYRTVNGYIEYVSADRRTTIRFAKSRFDAMWLDERQEVDRDATKPPGWVRLPVHWWDVFIVNLKAAWLLVSYKRD